MKRQQRRTGRLRRTVSFAMLVAGFSITALTGFAAPAATAATSCDLDVCVIIPDTVQTPVGAVTVTVSAANVVSVQVAPTVACTLVLGIPFAVPPGPPALPNYSRTSVQTTGGEVDIDTIAIPPGPPCRSLPNVAIISIHPPSPCRVSTRGTLVTFTPIRPVGATG